MSLSNTGGMPLTLIGAANRQGDVVLTVFSSSLLDATNEACIWIGQFYWDDGGTHTVDTTGSSALACRLAAVTWANGSSTAKIGLAALDTSTGPTGRAANVANVITFDVSKSLTGGAGVTLNAWNSFVPDAGTKTIAHGDFIAAAFQVTNRAGVDLINVSNTSGQQFASLGYVTNYLGGTYTNPGRLCNLVVTASDGTLGFFYGSVVADTIGISQSWSSGSVIKEYGNIIQLPYPARAYGIAAGMAPSNDCSLVLYTDPLGTPVAQRTVAVDANVVASTADSTIRSLFSSPYDMAANTPYAVSIKPGASNVSALYLTMNSSTHQKAWDFGTTAYAANRASGAFSAQNSNKDRFAVGLLVGAFENGLNPIGKLNSFGRGAPY